MSATKSNLIRRVREVAMYAAILALVLVTRASFADQYTVPSESMLPTVHVGDRVFVSKIAFGLRIPLTTHYLLRFDPPARGDVVVLESPVEDIVLLKRVVAVPGDHVQVHDGRLVLNGMPIPFERRGDSYIEDLSAHVHAVSLAYGGGPDFDVVVPRDRFLVLGDNRGNSHDGRFFGLVSGGSILGRARGVFLRDGMPVWRGL